MKCGFKYSRFSGLAFEIQRAAAGGFSEKKAKKQASPQLQPMDITEFSGLTGVFQHYKSLASALERDVPGAMDTLHLRNNKKPTGRGPAKDAMRAALWHEFESAAVAILGRGYLEKSLGPQDFEAIEKRQKKISVLVDSGAINRDSLAVKLNALGYSATEIADVVSKRISVRALDNAHKMLMRGDSEQDVSDYLGRNYEAIAQNKIEMEKLAKLSSKEARRGAIPKRPLDMRYSKAGLGGIGKETPVAERKARLEGVADDYANRYGVRSELVKAIIKHESNWNPQAVSCKGAIGVMQIMPGTAGILGVNPWNPEQNIEGGVRYLRGLIDAYGSERLGLIAYNAGPGFVERYMGRKVALYGETQAYLKNIGRETRID